MYTNDRSGIQVVASDALYVYNIDGRERRCGVRASDRAYRTLLDEIQSGRLAPGAVLGEVEQAARLGVSRTPLREALGRLAADGLVVQQSPRVTVVSDLDAGDIRELFEVRRALEETAARLAAARGDAATFATLADEFAGAPLDGAAAADDYYRLIARFDDGPRRVRRQRLPHLGAARHPHAPRARAPARARQSAPARGIRRRAPAHRLGDRRARRRPRRARHPRPPAQRAREHPRVARRPREGAPATSGGTRTTHIHQGAA